MKKLRRFIAGFTLMELSISLLVFSLLLGGALVMTTDILTEKKIKTDQEKLAEIKEALEAFMERNDRYPCVASPTTVLGSATYGREILANCVTDTSAPGDTVRVASSGEWIRIGALPVRDLLLPDDYMQDSFGSHFTYAVTEALTSTTTFEDNGGKITLNDGTGQTISIIAAYVVLSHGLDSKGAYSSQSGASKVACGATTNLDVENCNGDTIFTRALFNRGSVAAKYFDDTLIFTNRVEPPLGTGYAEVTLPNPGSALTDFTYFISLNSMPSDWWTEVSVGGSDIRATDGNSNRLPVDVIEFTDSGSSGSGLIAVKWTGSKGSAGTDKLRIWVGNGTALPAATHTYGQYNAYPSALRAVYPSGGGNDRTSYLHHLNMVNGATAGNAAGPIDGSKATTYNGTNQYGYTNDTPNEPTSTQTHLGMFYTNSDSANQGIMGVFRGGNDFDHWVVNLHGAVAGDPVVFYANRNNNFHVDTTAGYTISTWQHATGIYGAGGACSVYLNAANVGTGTAPFIPQNTTEFTVAKGSRHNHSGAWVSDPKYFNGSLSFLRFYTGVKTLDWITYDNDMLDPADPDQSDFYGTWTWNDYTP